MLEKHCEHLQYRSPPDLSLTCMTHSSYGPHRAFMGVAITLCVCLGLTMSIGWQWYFKDQDKRAMIFERAKVHESRLRELEKLGLDAEAGIIAESKEDAEAAKVSLQDMAPKSLYSDSAVPVMSEIKELPLEEASDDYKEAQELIEKFWKAPGVKEREPYVFGGAEMLPLMQDYYVMQKETDPDHTELKQKSRFLINEHEILYFSYASSRPTGLAEVAMRRGENGKFLIDWESLNGVGEMSFAKFRELRPTKPVMLRAYVRIFEYYNYEFTDSDKFMCIKLLASNGVDSIYSYCERESELGRWLTSNLASTVGNNSVNGYTVRVSFPEKAQSDQCVLLNQVVAPRWLLMGK
jgi:hypothetical protein